MPRDLMAERANQNSEPKDKISRDMDKLDNLAKIKPYVKNLTLSDVNSCVKLEDATFPPQERATREKFEYRLTKSGELCLGLFTSANTSDTSSPISTAETASTALPVYSGAPDRKSVLLAHCIVTKTTNSTILDEDMDVPQDWRNSTSANAGVGHKEAGRTIAIHSLAVLPPFQGQGLGATLLKAFIQRIDSSQAADRIVLLAHDDLIKFYEKFGFENKGPSKATFGGAQWVDMVLEFKNAKRI